jgi:anthranilate/para-aminobenzoate synthase component I
MTPLELAAMLPIGSGRAVLMSGRDDDGLGQRSFVSACPRQTFYVVGDSYHVVDSQGSVIDTGTGDVVAALEKFVGSNQWRDRVHHSCEVPCVVGYLGYEFGAALEAVATSPRQIPDVVLAAYDACWSWQHGDEPRLLARSDEAGQSLAALLQASKRDTLAPRFSRLTAIDTVAQHCARVEAVKQYIEAGDVYQVNIARRWQADVVASGDPLQLLVRIDAVAPAPYSCMFEFDRAADHGANKRAFGSQADHGVLLSASPELFLQQRGRAIETRPIKGTRRRTGDLAADARAKQDLVASAKDSAEHLMIVDLERNDLGRVCEVGSVRVSDLGYIVELPHLYHRVSRVIGQLRSDVGLADLLRATFPGGSITGAPKVRAMQIISELEDCARGPYCGAFGWFGSDCCELAIGIRIAVLTSDVLDIRVGGGIVADSDPLAEVAETDDKIAGWRHALASLATE